MAKKSAPTIEAKLPKLMEGFVYWYDLDEYPKLTVSDVKGIKEEYEQLPLNRGNIIPNPKFKNEIVIFDIVQSMDHYPASFRGFLYSDGKLLGSLHWNNPTKDVEKIEGSYKKSKDGLILKAVSTESDGSKDGMYVELKK